MLTPEERALLNDQTIHGEGPARVVGPVTIADITFRRRRFMGRVFALMQANGATDAELLYGWIAAMALPEDVIRTAARDIAAWDDVLDGFFEQNFGGNPSPDILAAARAIFDHDMASLQAASVEVEPRPGGNDKDAPPNS
jgi:hypothetical protein